MVAVCMIGSMGSTALSKAVAQRLVQLGATFVSAEECTNKTTTYKVNVAPLDMAPPGVLKDDKISYGPPRKGKGGKVKRW